MCNIGAVMHWCFDCTNRPKCHSNYFICLRSVIWIGLDMGRYFVIIVDWVGLGHRVDGLDWIGFRNWTHVQLWPKDVKTSETKQF